jgi:hypothetical protein
MPVDTPSPQPGQKMVWGIGGNELLHALSKEFRDSIGEV